MMRDKYKTKNQLVKELSELRKQASKSGSEGTKDESDKGKTDINEKLYCSLFNKISIPIFIFERETQHILECNEAAVRTYGYSKDELKSMTPSELHAPEDFEKIKYNVDFRNVDPLFSYTHLTKYGQRLDVEITTDEFNYDGHPAWINIVSEITDRKEAEEKLKSAQDELKGRIKERTSELIALNKRMKREITERERAEDELKESFKKLRKTLEGTVHAMAIVGEARDPYTAGHQRRVAELACAIAKEMDLHEEQIEGIRIAGLLHDIGKMSIPTEILTKPGRLTEIEFTFIKNHPQVGFDILKGIEFPWRIAQIVLQHHERLDGSGYPSGLLIRDILLEARILGVADVVEAMSSHRPYRAARGIDKALGEILENSGLLYDPKVVNICLKVFAEKRFGFE